MTLRDKLNLIMGAKEEEDKRGPSTCFAPWAAKCPVEDCEDKGRYTNCYLEETRGDCYIYNQFTQSLES